MATSIPHAGDVLELTVGEVVHGGWCVSRQDDTGLVVFVRHALPGERVRAAVTQATAHLARAEAIEIQHASADRVTAPCPYARPAGCGGCDWQHASLDAQRRLKAAVIRQQLSRIAGLDLDVVVDAVPGDEAGLGWRTVVSFAVDHDGVAGLRRHRSHEVVAIDRCLIAHEEVTAASVTDVRWPRSQAVEIAVEPQTGERAVLVAGPRARPSVLPDIAVDSVQISARRGASGGRPAGPVAVRGHGYLTRRAAGRDWRVSLGGFWQVHPGAADLLGQAMLAALDPKPGEVALDLYCGAGLFAGLLAEAVGPEGAVLAVEQDPAAARDARHNLRPWPWARVHRGDAAEVLARTGLGGASIGVLDPPRTGAAAAVIEALCGSVPLGGRPPESPRGSAVSGGRPPESPSGAPAGLRRLAYVSCDPATLARDLRRLLDGGWQLTGLRGYDAFPMTHHVECLAVLARP